MTSPPVDRVTLIDRALLLSWLSVAWAAVSGAASLLVGALDHSLAIVGVGLTLLGDLAGSTVLIWRFVQARHGTHREHSAERTARAVVGISLVFVAAFLIVQSIRRLGEGTGPTAEGGALAVAAVSIAVLAPLSRAKRRLGARLGSAALRGDGTLSGVGAAIAAVALSGLILTRTLGWWWADSAAALTVALVAGVEVRVVFAAATHPTAVNRLDQ
jgi:divalent metal cation (Fe/Co/Zn/Cd) transporter